MSLPTIGQKAPDFSLPDADGKTWKRADFKGQKIVLYFYPKDDTPGCTVEGIEFSALLPAFRKKNAVVIGISKDGPVSHKNFIDKYRLKVLLLSDIERKTLNDYGVWQEKKMYGKTVEGTARTTFLIDEKGFVEKIWNKVQAKTHAQSVLDSI